MKTKKTAKRKYTKRATTASAPDASLHALLIEHYRAGTAYDAMGSHMSRISALIDSRLA